MKKKHITIIPLLIVLSIIIYYSCKKENTDTNVVRAAAKLVACDIPALRCADAVRAGEEPSYGKLLFESGAQFDFVKFYYSWSYSPEDIVNVDQSVFDSKDQAHEYLLERLKNNSAPEDLIPPKDIPVSAGNISYANGRQFIRDNISIEIHAEGIFSDAVTEIAQQIDDLLLKTPSATSVNQLKPIINEFKITQNPVKEYSTTKLIIDIVDPLDKKLFFTYAVSPAGSDIKQDDKGNYYFYAGADEPEGMSTQLIIQIVSESGFYADSTISIQIEKE